MKARLYSHQQPESSKTPDPTRPNGNSHFEVTKLPLAAVSLKSVASRTEYFLNPKRKSQRGNIGDFIVRR